MDQNVSFAEALKLNMTNINSNNTNLNNQNNQTNKPNQVESQGPFESDINSQNQNMQQNYHTNSQTNPYNIITNTIHVAMKELILPKQTKLEKLIDENAERIEALYSMTYETNENEFNSDTNTENGYTWN